MWNLLFESLRTNPEMTLGLVLGSLGIIGATAVILGTTYICFWAEVRQQEETSALKRDLLERGMSAEEIATVVAAKPGKRDSKRQQGWGERHRAHC